MNLELDLLVPVDTITPTLRILLILRNKRPDEERAEIVAIHVLKLSERDSNRYRLRYGMLDAFLLNLAHPRDAAQFEIENENPLLTRHTYNHAIPNSLWDTIARTPEHWYSTSVLSGTGPSTAISKHSLTWLVLSIQPDSSSQNPHSLVEQSLSTLDERYTPSLVSTEDSDQEISFLDARFAPEQVDFSVFSSEPFDMKHFKVLGDAWDPKWRNPAQPKHDKQMERLAAMDSWDINPGQEDRNKLEDIERRFSTWSPLTDQEKDILWKYRGYLKRASKPLFLFASCVKWSSPKHVEDAMRLICGNGNSAIGLGESASHPSISSPSTPVGAAPPQLSTPSSIKNRPSARNISSGKMDTLEKSQRGGHSPKDSLPPKKHTTTPSRSHDPPFSQNTPTRIHIPQTTPQNQPPKQNRDELEKSDDKLASPFAARFTAATSGNNHADAKGSHNHSTPSLTVPPRSVTPPLSAPATPTGIHSIKRTHSSTSSSNLSHASLVTRISIMEEPWKVAEVIDILPMLTWRHAPALRKFLIQNILKHAPLDEIALQVVHALRYEDVPLPPNHNPRIIQPILRQDYAGISFERTPHSHSNVSVVSSTGVPIADFELRQTNGPDEVLLPETPLLDLLIERAQTKPLGFHIYWYLAADDDLKPHFEVLSSKLKGEAIGSTIERQSAIHDAIRTIGLEGRDLPGDLRIKAITDTVNKFGLTDPRFMDAAVALPIDPTKYFLTIDPTSSHVFKSSNKPIKLTIGAYQLTKSSTGNLATSSSTPLSLSSYPSPGSVTNSLNASSAPDLMSTQHTPGSHSTIQVHAAAPSSTSSLGNSGLSNSSIFPSSGYYRTTLEYDVIYKYGDDLRHDQLMMLLIRMIDKELQSRKIDLKLVTYDVLPFSFSEGMMQCVSQTQAIEDILRSGLKLSGYLHQHNPTPEAYERALDNYVRSCAGNCVLNIVMGWGDRHLANLLLTQDGHLVHIDFGYIFGEEPNWSLFRILLRLSNEMLEPLMGDEKWMTKFYGYAQDAYQIIRKIGHRIMSVLYVMRSSFINQESSDGASLSIIKFVRERLYLGLSEDEARERLNKAFEDAPENIRQKMSNRWRGVVPP